jgi:hypothetical protein
MDSNNGYSLYDKQLSALKGLPDCVEVRPTTMRVVAPLIGASQTFIVQTVRQAEKGDHVFLEVVDATGTVRIVLPPQVANAIARQRESLTTRVRSKVAKRVAQERKDRGELPGFMRPKK